MKLNGTVHSLKSIFSLLLETIRAAVTSKVPRLGAALAYYTLFAMAPLFVIALAIVGFCFGAQAARRELFGQISGLVGREGGEALQAMIVAADKPRAGTVATCFAVVTLCLGATGVFVELQDALNTIWDVNPAPRRGLWTFVRNRMLSFAMVLGVGFLLLVSLMLSAALAAVGKFVSGIVPGQHLLLVSANFILSLALITLLFAVMFKILPDAKIAWRDVWIGGLITAVLFNIGKFLLGFYLGKSSVTSIYGAAGSLLILILWVYYSAQILFFGAKFTQLYANKYGSHVQSGAETSSVQNMKSKSTSQSRAR